MTHQTDLPTDLAVRVTQDIGRFFGGGPVRIKSVEHIRNPYSDVYRVGVRIRAQAACVYVKVPHHTPANQTTLTARLQTEFTVMRELADRWRGDRRFGVADPIAFYPEIPAVLTLAATGRPLRERYRTTARRVGMPFARAELLQCASGCGEWLREFQAATCKGVAPFDIDELLSYCDVRIRLLLEDTRSGFSSSLASRLITKAQTVAKTSLRDGTPVTGRHNDFASHNLISAGGTVRVIDFSMFDYGAAAYDPCNFWLELEMLKYDWTYSRSFLTQLQDRFLGAYGNIQAHDPAFALARIRYSLNRLLTALGERDGWRPDARYRRRAAEVSCDWLTNFADS